MARYFSIDIRCSACEHEWHELIDRDTDTGEYPCIRCSGLGRRAISAPNVTRASYADGTKRFQDAKEASKLNRAAAVATGSNKKELEKEIKKIGFKFDKSIT